MDKKKYQSGIRQTITFDEIMNLIFKNFIKIFVCGIICAFIAGTVTKYLMDPIYEATTTMYVYTNLESNHLGSISNSDLQAAETLAETYCVILKSNQVMYSVGKELEELNISTDRLDDNVEVSIIDNTQLLQVTVREKDPSVAYEVANAYAAVGPKEIVRVTKAGGVEIVDNPEMPKHPVGPSTAKNSVFAFLAGTILMFIFCFVLLIRDTTIYSEKEIMNITDKPVIGNVPIISIDQYEPWNLRKRDFEIDKEE